MGALSLFFPNELLLPLLMVAGICLILGMKRMAGSIFVFVLASAILPPFITPLVEKLIDVMPLWAVILAGGFLCLALFRAAAALIIGRDAANDMIGILAADLVKGLLFLPVRVVRFMTRFFGQ
jgi:hypothetical protein